MHFFSLLLYSFVLFCCSVWVSLPFFVSSFYSDPWPSTDLNHTDKRSNWFFSLSHFMPHASLTSKVTDEFVYLTDQDLSGLFSVLPRSRCYLNKKIAMISILAGFLSLADLMPDCKASSHSFSSARQGMLFVCQTTRYPRNYMYHEEN